MDDLFSPEIVRGGRVPCSFGEQSSRGGCSDHFEQAPGKEDGIIKAPRAKPPDVIWLPELDRSPENFKRAMHQPSSIPKHRGLVLSPKGPGVRVQPEHFRRRAHDLLDGEDCRRSLKKSFGVT